MTLLLLAYTATAWLATASLAKILFISTQQGQWLDKLLGWQHRLSRWDKNGHSGLAKMGGYCELCFSHALGFISFWVYLLLMRTAGGIWITDSIDSWWGCAAANLMWYLVYVSIATNLSLYFIVKLFRP